MPGRRSTRGSTLTLVCALAIAASSCGDSAAPGGDSLVDAARDSSRREAAVGAETAPPDLADAAAPDVSVPASNGAFDGCRAFADCPTGRVCDFTLGRCDRRVDWTAPAPELLSFHPLAATPGDVVVIDAARIFQNALFPPSTIEVRIGGKAASAYGVVLDDTRVVVPITSALSGVVEVKADTGQWLRSKRSLGSAAAGERRCDGETPTARGSAGSSPAATGPHAAGTLDLGAHVARLFYPARCGGARRPAVKGNYPLVVLLHGNGGGYMAHEYLGQLLASWGFVALMPDAKVDYSASDPVAISTQQTQTLLAVIRAAHDVDLGALSAQLAGVRTGAAIAFAGHSRGTARIQHIVAADAAIRTATVATIFLGPVDDGDVVPGLFLLFAGDADAQSPSLVWGSAWLRQGKPKWKVELRGGNHSLYTDHKVWTGFLDRKPTLTRAEQMSIVARFALPLLQRAFKLKEPFSALLDSPPSDPRFSVEVQR